MLIFNIIFIILRAIGPVVCALQAEKKNRSTGLWGFLGFAFPIISMICIYNLNPIIKWNKEN